LTHDRLMERNTSSKLVSVFLDGDQFNKGKEQFLGGRFYEFLKAIMATHGDVQIITALNRVTDVNRITENLAELSLTKLPIIMQGETQGPNDADAILTFFCAKHSSQTNYILSNDRAWFEEMEFMDPSVQIIWLHDGRQVCFRDGSCVDETLARNGSAQSLAKQRQSVPLSVSTAFLKVFVEFDAVPYFELVEFLMGVVAEHPRIGVFIVVTGPSSVQDLIRQITDGFIPGLTPEQLYVHPTMTPNTEAASASLMYLYGKNFGQMNYVLSDGKSSYEKVFDANPSGQTNWLRVNKKGSFDVVKFPKLRSKPKKRKSKRAGRGRGRR